MAIVFLSKIAAFFLFFYFSLILIITIPRTTAELKDVGVFKATTEVF